MTKLLEFQKAEQRGDDTHESHHAVTSFALRFDKCQGRQVPMPRIITALLPEGSEGSAVFRTVREPQLFCGRGQKKRENDLLATDLMAANVGVFIHVGPCGGWALPSHPAPVGADPSLQSPPSRELVAEFQSYLLPDPDPSRYTSRGCALHGLPPKLMPLGCHRRG